MGRTKRGAQGSDKSSSKKSKTDEADPAAAEEHAEVKPTEAVEQEKKTIEKEQPAKNGKAGLAAGDDLPAFEVETDESTEEAKATVSSSDLVKESGIIIFFYPKANTGGCTTQGCGFNEHLEELQEAGYKVFGMSAGG